MSVLAFLIEQLNAAVSILSDRLCGPIALLPPWLFLMAVSWIFGNLLLIVFKYTSNPAALCLIRDRIKAHLLSMKIFRDNLYVLWESHLKIGWNILLLLVHSFVPMGITAFLFILLTGQLGLWFQTRPLRIGEQAVILLELAGSVSDPAPHVRLEPSEAVQVMIGPVRVPSKRHVYWQVQAKQEGCYQLTFQVQGCPFVKTLTIGDGFMPVSAFRPGPNLLDRLFYPAEQPFDKDSPVQSIRIHYPERTSILTGTDSWFMTFVGMSLMTVFFCKSLFHTTHSGPQRVSAS